MDLVHLHFAFRQSKATLPMIVILVLILANQSSQISKFWEISFGKLIMMKSITDILSQKTI